MDMIIGNKYKFIGQNDDLIYLGMEGAWYQFALTTHPYEVWCEVLDSELDLIEHIVEINND